MPQWKTDRSRYLTGLQDCLMKRYLKYHAGDHGQGWTKQRHNVATSTGLLVHSMLAEILAGCKAKGTVDRLSIRNAISKHRQQFVSDYLTKAPSVEVFTIKEQLHLAESLAWGWATVALPNLMANHEVVAVEQEMGYQLKVGDLEILQMLRPDLVTRHRQSGKLAVHDFKTVSSITPGWTESWRESVQMAVSCLGVEQAYGEKPESYYIHGLCKGGRGKFTKAGQATEEDRQYSPLCYARFYPPNPPISHRLTWKRDGYWADKSPVWEQECPDQEMSVAEWWVEELRGTPAFQDLFILAGPYANQQYLATQYMRAMPEHEKWWINNLWRLYEKRKDHAWDSPEFQAELDKLIPRSYSCWKYGTGYRCEMYEVCFKHTGWDNPEENGYQVREPHHPAEGEA